MSDYTFSITVRIPDVADIRPHLGAIAELASEYVASDGALSIYGGNGIPAWDVTSNAPETAYLEGESRYELEADWETFGAALDTEYPGAVLTLSEEWRGDGEPFARDYTWVHGVLQQPEPSPDAAALISTLERLCAIFGGRLDWDSDVLGEAGNVLAEYATRFELPRISDQDGQALRYWGAVADRYGIEHDDVTALDDDANPAELAYTGSDDDWAAGR